MSQVPLIDRLEAIASPYAAILCDVWGVVHNGVRSFPEAAAALGRMRRQGKAIVLITNAPRPRAAIEEQLAILDVPDESWHRVVTSGDVTRNLIREAPRKIFHIGPDRDLALYDGIDVELVEEFEASAVVCTGLFDDVTETPDDYAEMLARLRARDLPFICANPDIVVKRGDKLIYCAGALAREYGLLGGRTLIAGKPHRPIYDASLKAAREVLGRTVEPGEVLAIGDGALTDLKGAAGMGIDALFVTEGIHSREYQRNGALDPELLFAFLNKHGHLPIAATQQLA